MKWEKQYGIDIYKHISLAQASQASLIPRQKQRRVMKDRCKTRVLDRNMTNSPQKSQGTTCPSASEEGFPSSTALPQARSKAESACSS